MGYVNASLNNRFVYVCRHFRKNTTANSCCMERRSLVHKRAHRHEGLDGASANLRGVSLQRRPSLFNLKNDMARVHLFHAVGGGGHMSSYFLVCLHFGDSGAITLSTPANTSPSSIIKHNTSDCEGGLASQSDARMPRQPLGCKMTSTVSCLAKTY